LPSTHLLTFTYLGATLLGTMRAYEQCQSPLVTLASLSPSICCILQREKQAADANQQTF
jgi:hypothetical protein